MSTVAQSVVDNIDLPGVGGLAVGSAVLVLVFRTLWRQDGSWREIISTERATAEQFRAHAAEAHAAAASARADAHAARVEAETLRVELSAALAEARQAWAAHARERTRVDSLVAALRAAGVPLPADLD